MSLSSVVMRAKIVPLMELNQALLHAGKQHCRVIKQKTSQVQA